MSPEMANLFLKYMNGQEVNYPEDLVTLESDLFSLGILVYELLAQSPPRGYFKQQPDKITEKQEFLKLFIIQFQKRNVLFSITILNQINLIIKLPQRCKPIKSQKDSKIQNQASIFTLIVKNVFYIQIFVVISKGLTEEEFNMLRQKYSSLAKTELSDESVDFIKALTQFKPTDRLGANKNFDQLMSHPFFSQEVKDLSMKLVQGEIMQLDKDMKDKYEDKLAHLKYS